ncbi:manganese efflux pump MntP [Methylotenera sp. N17]|uniref:manganese efflux pump MntP n=1 Tax=Methylotenera sp. N17 TaxID=1502761 RepID=UPI0006465B01|nr:manganese efflux pump MntP [Methylotenera sp. N17]
MNLTSILLIALAMSTDAFAAAISKGARLHQPKLSEAVRTGLIFGVIEFITPVIGWLIGSVASKFVADWDHWIAFTLLAVLGLHMIYEGIQTPTSIEEKPSKHSFLVLAVTAFATSIDAMAVGVSLAFIDVSIILTAVAIGVATFTMVTIGFMLGRVLGVVVGKRSEVFGGVVLIGIGSYILYEHLNGLA